MECVECGEEFHSTRPPVCLDCIDDFSKCDNCGEWFRENGKPFCDDCMDDFEQCEDCHTWCHTAALTYTEYLDKSICGSCLDKNYFSCDDCGKFCPNSECITTHSGRDICDSCYSDDYFTCEECGQVFHCDDCSRDYLCNECDRNNPNLHDYDYKPEPIFHGVTNPYYGIELETDYYNDPISTAENLTRMDLDETVFYLKADGSLDEGIEIVFHPRNFRSWHEFDFQPILTEVRNGGGKSFKTHTCGLHIHRSNKDLSTVTKIKLILFFGFCSRQIITLAQRKTHYAKFTPFTEIPDKGVCYKVIKKGYHVVERCQAVNFRNKDTIEFRVFRGTLKLSTIMAYLAFCHYVVEFCKGTLLHEFIDGTSLWGKFTHGLSDKEKLGMSNLCEYLKRKELL